MVQTHLIFFLADGTSPTKAAYSSEELLKVTQEQLTAAAAAKEQAAPEEQAQGFDSFHYFSPAYREARGLGGFRLSEVVVFFHKPVLRLMPFGWFSVCLDMDKDG